MPPALDGASALKEEGNALFKTGNYTAAFLKYNEGYILLGGSNDDGDTDLAHTTSYQRAVLLSNRSNCLFELGRYDKSIEDARKCLDLLAGSEDDDKAKNLERKNLLRIARCGIYGPSISSNEEGDNGYIQNVTEPLTQLSACGDEAFEKRATRMLEQAQNRREALLANEERERSVDEDLPPLPSIHRASLYGSTMREYYNYGHDSIVSALSKGEPSEEGSTVPACPAMELSKLPDSDLSSFALLFGGVGDARHVFATLCDVHKQWSGLKDTKKKKFRLHIVLNDVVPTVLARDTLMFALFAKLGQLAPTYTSLYASNRQNEAFRIATLLQYIFFGYVMPPSVHDHLIEVIDGLVGNDFFVLKSWLIAPSSTWSQIKDIMMYWRNAEEGKDNFPTTLAVLKDIYRIEPPKDSIYQEGTEAFDRVQGVKEERREKNSKRKDELLQWLENLTTVEEFNNESYVESIRSQIPSHECTDARLLDELKNTVRQNITSMDADDMADTREGLYSSGRFMDEVFLKETKGIIPPEGYQTAGKIYDLIWEVGPQEASMLIDEAKSDVVGSWKVNRTMFDPIFTDFFEGKMDRNEFNPIAEIVPRFLWQDGVLTSFEDDAIAPKDVLDLDFFGCTSLLFWNTAHSVAQLLAIQSLSFEVSIAPITDCCRMIQDDHMRVHPSKFHRIFLSNVPDYIGMLSVFTEVFPVLHRPSKYVPTFVQASVLLNNGIWKDYEHYIFSSTAIPNVKEVSKLLGFQYLTYNSVWAHQNQWTWSTKQAHATRDELTRWLHRLLIFALLPPLREPFGDANEQCTTNVATLMRVCVFCVESLGYPPHWIGSFLDELVAACSSEFLKTRANVPTTSPVVYDEADKLYRIGIGAFKVEIMSQLQLWTRHCGNALAPMINIPCTAQDQCSMYQLALPKDYLTIVGDPRKCSGAGGKLFTMVLGFILSEKKNADGMDMFWARSMPPMPHMGPTGKIRGDALRTGTTRCHIFSCMAFVFDERKQEYSIAFYMSKADYEKYSKHYIIPIRTDRWDQIGFGDEQMRLREAERVHRHVPLHEMINKLYVT